MFQKTIKKSIKFKGVGIHTGETVDVKLNPLPVNSGVVFKRNNDYFKLSVDSIFSTKRSMVIGNETNNIKTIEHLIAALYMAEISNILVEVKGGEIPIMDGSALSFFKLLNSAVIVAQTAEVPVISLKKPVVFEAADKFVAAIPSDRFGVSYTVDFPHPELRNRTVVIQNITKKVFKKQIAPARTFGFLEEVEQLRKNGLALGGSLKNAVVLTSTGYLNKKLRFKDECVRHKILDLIGAVSILGKRINSFFVAYKSGHSLDFELIKKINSIVN